MRATPGSKSDDGNHCRNRCALFLKRREFGKAIGFYRHHLATFVGIGSATIPIGIAFNLLVILVRQNPPLDWVLKWLDDTAGARLTVAAMVGGVQQLAMIVLVAPPIIVAIREIQVGRNPGVIRTPIAALRCSVPG